MIPVALVARKLAVKTVELPSEVEELLNAADRRIEAFLESQDGGTLPGFVPSDFVRVYEVLAAVRKADIVPENTFCEWGSGIGVVACLAAMQGYETYGIEIADELVDESRELAAEHNLDVTFSHGSYIPEGGEPWLDSIAETAWIESGGADAYEDLGLDVDDFGLIFAYPWPGDEQVLEDLFDHYAATDAVLLTFHGIEDLKVQIKR